MEKRPMLRSATLFILSATLLCGTLLAAAADDPAPVPAPEQVAAATSQPTTTKQTISQKIAADQSKLDINTATAAQLKALPGIGDAYAARIIAGRPYTMKTQIEKRGILPESAYSAISDKIIAHRPKK
ncbi:MAG: ComEA family DNA-binding protein [Acidobacteriaceae bacterium]